jgi:hypothetical protein
MPGIDNKLDEIEKRIAHHKYMDNVFAVIELTSYALWIAADYAHCIFHLF